MSIEVKVEKESTESREIKYPCVMESAQGTLVLFKEENIGTVIGHSTNNKAVIKGNPIGYYSDTWFTKEYFTAFEGSITIKSIPFKKESSSSNDMVDAMNYVIQASASDEFINRILKESKGIPEDLLDDILRKTIEDISIEKIYYTVEKRRSVTTCIIKCPYKNIVHVASGACQSCPSFHDIDEDQSILYCKEAGLRKQRTRSIK